MRSIFMKGEPKRKRWNNKITVIIKSADWLTELLRVRPRDSPGEKDWNKDFAARAPSRNAHTQSSIPQAKLNFLSAKTVGTVIGILLFIQEQQEPWNDWGKQQISI